MCKSHQRELIWTTNTREGTIETLDLFRSPFYVDDVSYMYTYGSELAAPHTRNFIHARNGSHWLKCESWKHPWKRPLQSTRFSIQYNALPYRAFVGIDEGNILIEHRHSYTKVIVTLINVSLIVCNSNPRSYGHQSDARPDGCGAQGTPGLHCADGACMVAAPFAIRSVETQSTSQNVWNVVYI